MIRAVVDVSVLVRAVIKPNGTVGPVLGRLRDAAYVALYSDALLAEIVDVLHRPRIRVKYQLADEDIETVLALILLRGEPVKATTTVTACRDPKDDKLPALALDGHADLIVSGDDDLRVLDPFKGIPIVGPADFLARLAVGT
jgi:putative PIN family toxin of toxin-antitoxin system